MGNWHIDLIAEHLEAVHIGQIKRLCLNLPPRFGKSTLVTVCFPCWEWREDPTLRFMFASYAQSLCTKHSMDRRRIIQSPWYQGKWGHLVRLAKDENLKSRFQNTATGHMLTAPVGGTATGLGGNRLVIDDIMNPKKADSELERETALNHYRNTLITRRDDSDRSATIIVEQRLRKDDLTGTLTGTLPPAEGDEVGGIDLVDGWVRLRVPIEAKIATRYRFPLSGREKVMARGELLDARRRSRADIDEMISGQHGMGQRIGAAQLYQTPSEEEGARFKRAWWRYLREVPPDVSVSLWVWDTAVKAKEHASKSAGVRMCRFPGGVVFTDVVDDHVEFPALKRMVRDHYRAKPTDLILVEDKSSGQQLIQELRAPDDGSAPLPVMGTDPEFNKLEKVQRAALVEPKWETGQVYVLADQPWVAATIDQYAEFPNGQFKDRVDAGVHGVNYLLRAATPAPYEEPYEQAEDFQSR